MSQTEISKSTLLLIEAIGLGVFGIDRWYATGEFGWIPGKTIGSVMTLGMWPLFDYMRVLINALSGSESRVFVNNGVWIRDDRGTYFAYWYAISMLIGAIFTFYSSFMAATTVYAHIDNKACKEKDTNRSELATAYRGEEKRGMLRKRMEQDMEALGQDETSSSFSMGNFGN